MSAHPKEAPKESPEKKEHAEGHKPADAVVAAAADATHAKAAEAAKPAEAAKDTLTKLVAEHDTPKKKAIVEALHLSLDEAKDAKLKEDFLKAVHGDHPLEEAVKAKFEKAAHAKEEKGHGDHGKKEEHGKKDAHAKEEHPKDDHGDDAHAEGGSDHAAEGEHDAPHAATPHATPATPAAEAPPKAKGKIRSFFGHFAYELPASILRPTVKAPVQTLWQTLKGGWSFMRGMVSKKYRENGNISAVPLNPKEAPPAANDNVEHAAEHEKKAAHGGGH